MDKKSAVFICLAFVAAGALVKLLPQGTIMKGYSGTRTSFSLSDTDACSVKDGYHVSFPLEKTPRGLINCYMLKYRPNSFEAAKKHAGMFIDVESFNDDEYAYIFSGPQGSISIDKEINQIHFEASPPEGKGEPVLSDEEAIKIASNYIERRMLVLIYDEVQVHYDGFSYRVNFINRISNLRNYAFSNRVTLDNHGQVLTVDYFAIQYDKVGECGIKSMKNAFDELPDLDGGETVLLSSCQLVYIYDDSIIQPAYYFLGNASEGKTYECFVKAAEF